MQQQTLNAAFGGKKKGGNGGEAAEKGGLVRVFSDSELGRGLTWAGVGVFGGGEGLTVAMFGGGGLTVGLLAWCVV